MAKLFGWLLLAVLGLFLLHRWVSLESMGEQRAARLEQPGKEMLVGVSWPFAEDHDGFANGLRLAQQEINQEGGVQLRLDARNSNGSWSQERGVALEFARNANMSAVIGYRDDSHAIRASALYERSRLLHLVLGSTSTALTDHGNPYIVRTLVSADKVARSLAQAGPDARKSYALVWEKDGEWDSLVAEYRIAQNRRQANNSYEQAYRRGLADFRRTVHELKAVAPDLIVFVGNESAAADFLARANTVKLSQNIICVCLATPQLKALAGAGYGRTMLLDFYDAHAGGTVNQEFVARYQARYQRLPDTWAAQGYDALKLLAEAVLTTGSRRPEELVLALRYQPAWEGANGSYKFDASGDMADKPIFLKRYRDGVAVSAIALTGVPDDLPPVTSEPVLAPERP